MRTDPELAVEAEEGACTDHRPAKQEETSAATLPDWIFTTALSGLFGPPEGETGIAVYLICNDQSYVHLATRRRTEFWCKQTLAWSKNCGKGLPSRLQNSTKRNGETAVLLPPKLHRVTTRY